ncbi:MAG: hypothetical protein D6761_01365 [Candidatus Dadabacteria bacterium]|nr:MAG: hypothetical protein D6761_01365 [Candidatus Dadabacteria bacterium]
MPRAAFAKASAPRGGIELALGESRPSAAREPRRDGPDRGRNPDYGRQKLTTVRWSTSYTRISPRISGTRI